MLSTSEVELRSNPTFWTAVTANPSKQWNYKILATNVDASTTPFGLAVKIEIQYDVLFTVPVDEGPSSFAPSAGIRTNSP